MKKKNKKTGHSKRNDAPVQNTASSSGITLDKASETTFLKRMIRGLENRPAVAVLLLIFIALSGAMNLLPGAEKLWSAIFPKREISAGQLGGRILEPGKEFTIDLAGNTFTYRWEKVAGGFDLNTITTNLLSTVVPIQLYFKNDSLMIDAVFKTRDGRQGSIRGNTWFSKLKGFDINHRLNAFEVVDDQLEPVLQIYLAKPNYVFIGGSFYDANQRKRTFSVTGISDVELPVHKLFKYPSSDHPEELAVSDAFLARWYNPNKAAEARADMERKMELERRLRELDALRGVAPPFR